MSRPDEGLIHTWLDGECTPEESARIEALVASDPEWAAAVAEARGLVAASSRILGALDAVPGDVIPSGGTASPAVQPTARRFRVRPWMAVAASLVLVLGTASVLQERIANPFTESNTPTADVAGEASGAAAFQTAPPAAPPARSSAVPPVAPQVATQEARQVAQKAAQQAAEQAAQQVAREENPAVRPSARPSAPAVAAAVSAPADAANQGIVAAEAQKREREADALLEARQLRAATAADSAQVLRLREQSRSLDRIVIKSSSAAAPERILNSPNSIAISLRLDGCWNATAPDSLVGLWRAPRIVREQLDTLVLALDARREVLVIRDGDALRGGLTALRVDCPRP